ncbi:LytR/AlgR family response regulator transcription factor [Owenweeksia hongkongensis]|uniref:LytR/AlgR family response regulator transcription factor n=1 Tax=Owenweeksia hongkongensis TaxID=253245 RepID=UPI003A92CFC4
MKVLIIEDEERAAKRLKRLVEELLPQAEILGMLVSVSESVKWLKVNKDPDVILMDIELADGKSFEIFESYTPSSHIIFCTAFDQYAIDAFKYQGMAYLLKPIKKIELEGALEKVKKQSASGIDYELLAETLANREMRYQKRILVKLGQRLKAIPVDQVAYAFTEAKSVMVMTFEGKDIPVDQSLEQLMQILDPKKFFRINRKLIVSLDSIDNMYTWSRSRVKLELTPSKDLDTIVATDRASNFKEWLEGKAF